MKNKEKLIVRHAALTDIGKTRESNEDFFVTDDWLGIYILADGMGGHAAGEVAARMACDVVLEFLGRPPDPPPFKGESLLEALNEANRRVYEASRSDQAYHGMGTTLTIMWRKGDRVLVGHVGDSRLYGLGKNGLVQMTDDHEEPITGYLTSAIGVAEEIYEVDLFECQVRSGEYYLLATDGLFSDRRRRRVDDEEIEEMICRHNGDLAAACTEMVQTACDRIGDDNITVVLLYIADTTKEESEPEESEEQ